MKRILTIIFLLVLNFSLKAQILQQPNTYGIGWKRTGADTLLYIPSDTLQVPSWGVGKTHIARKGTALYYWDGSKWSAITGSGSTYTAGYGLILNANEFKADTATLFPAVRATISNEYVDSLRLSGLNLQARKNGNWYTQFALTPYTDTIWREPGKDSIFWRKNGISYAIKDSGGGSSAPDTINKQLTSIVSPTSLTFSLKRKERWIGFIDSKDELLNLSGDMFNRTDLFTTTGPAVTQSTSAGKMTLSIAGGGFALSTMKFPVAPKGSFWCMEVKITAYTGTQYLGIGLVKDSANFVGGELQLASSASSGMNVINNSFNSTAGGTIPSWSGELTIYVVMSGDYMRMAWADQNGQVTWGVTCDLEYSRGASTKTVLGGDYGFGFYLATGSGAASVTFKSIRAGYFKGVGLSDISWVTKEDGTPLIDGNSAFFTASTKGFTTGDAAGMCTGVYQFNLKSFEYERRSLIFHETSTNVVNDAAPNLIYDTERKRFKYFVPRWGEDRSFTMSGTSSRMLYKEVDENLLTGVHVIDSMSVLNIGGRDVTYDPAVVKYNGEWYMGLNYYPSGSISGAFRFALVKTTDFSTFTTIVDNSSYNNYEGQKVVKIADTIFIATASSSVFRFFKLDGTDRGSISTPLSGLTQPQHPGIIPVQANGKTRFLLLTFDTGNSSFHPSYGLNNYTNGNTYIYLSNQTEQGYEYPIYRTPYIYLE